MNNKTPNIYRVIRSDGSFVSGSCQMLSRELKYAASYLRGIADTGHITRRGDRVETVVKNWNEDEPRCGQPGIYIAEKSGENPIIGPIIDIAKSIHYSMSYLKTVCRLRKATESGWSVRKATKDEVSFFAGGSK